LTHATETHAQPRPLPLTCGGCGCWCDDIAGDGDDRPHLSGPCDLGRGYFAVQAANRTARAARQDGRVVDQQLDRLAALLTTARRPLLTGLSFSSLEAQRLAVAVADRCRALIDPWQSVAAVAKLTAFQQSGDVTATWGELKNRADVVIYWRCRPTDAPRFRRRYGDLADGDLISPTQRTVFVVGSNIDRDLWLVDPPSGGPQIHFLDVGPCDPTNLRLLAQAAAGLSPLPVELLSAHIDLASWSFLQSALEQAKYGVVVVGDLLTGREQAEPTNEVAQVALYQLLTRWVAARNSNQRFVSVPFPKSANQGIGIQAALSWRTGYPMSLDFSRGYPNYDPINFRWRSLIEQDHVDAIFLIMGDCQLSAQCPTFDRDLDLLNRWAQHRPLIESGTKQRVRHAEIHLGVAGLADAQKAQTVTVCRPDGVMLPFRATGRGQGLSEAEMLERLLKKL